MGHLLSKQAMEPRWLILYFLSYYSGHPSSPKGFMRLWSIHPHYLDAKGLVALWREGLLAQNVLLGKTKGYQNHPQLHRFKNSKNPVGAIASYLRKVVAEANQRGYQFDQNKIVNRRLQGTLAVTQGQLSYEFQHLLKKLQTRDSERHQQWKMVKHIAPHPLFEEVIGGVEVWEIV